jgi:hypothetical protein
MPGYLLGPITGFVDRMKGKGMCSSSFLTQFGKGAALTAGGGNLAAFCSQAGVGNGADTTEDTLFTGTLPPNSMDIVGRQIDILAWGNISATSATKTAKVYWGSTVLATIGATTTQTGVWIVSASIIKTGANQQTACVTIDTSISGSLVRTASILSPNEADTAGIIMKVTGQVSAGGAGIVTCNGFVPSGYN